MNTACSYHFSLPLLLPFTCSLATSFFRTLSPAIPVTHLHSTQGGVMVGGLPPFWSLYLLHLRLWPVVLSWILSRRRARVNWTLTTHFRAFVFCCSGSGVTHPNPIQLETSDYWSFYEIKKLFQWNDQCQFYNDSFQRNKKTKKLCSLLS